MERDVLSERIRDNLKMKKLRGEKTGGNVPYGYNSYIKKYVKRDSKKVPLYALKENKQEQRRIPSAICAPVFGRPHRLTSIARFGFWRYIHQLIVQF